MNYYADEFFAKCLDDLQAQTLIMSYKGIKLDHLALRHNEHVHWTDNESINVTKASYLISFRSSYLSLRQGNHRVIQLYYPHRFSKQFGYPQDLLRGLPEIFRTRTLEAVYQHWESCTRLVTTLKLLYQIIIVLKSFQSPRLMRIGGLECVILVRKFLLLLQNRFASSIFVAYSDGFLCIWINAIRVSSRSCNISWILKSEGKHCRFATTSSSSLVLLGSAPKTFSITLPNSSFSKISWQETIWVDVIIPLLTNSGGKYSPKVIGVMSFCTNRSSTCIIACFLLGFFSCFFLHMSKNILLTLFFPRKICVWMRFLLLIRSSSCY